MSYYEYHVARRYVQFEGALRELPRYAALIGKKVLVLTACAPVTERVTAAIREGLSVPTAELLDPKLIEESPRYAGYRKMADRLDDLRAEMQMDFYDLGDPVVCEKVVRETAEYVRAGGYDTVVGIGGGKGLDLARAVTHFVDVRVILVPTLCATNASISTLSVIYSEDGQQIREYWRMDNAPDLVLADTALLVDNGPRILAAGMGDIMATYYEAICNVRLAHNEAIFSDLSYQGVLIGAEILKKKGPEAVEDVKRGVISPAFESVLSMILHNCGPMWTICTMGFGHVLDEIFLAIPASHKTPHGLRVGYSVIIMLRHQGAEKAEIDSYIDFCKKTGIPTSLSALGMDGVTRSEWLRAAEETVGKSGTINTLPYQVTAEEIIDCMLSYEAEIAKETVGAE